MSAVDPFLSQLAAEISKTSPEAKVEALVYGFVKDHSYSDGYLAKWPCVARGDGQGRHGWACDCLWIELRLSKLAGFGEEEDLKGALRDQCARMRAIPAGVPAGGKAKAQAEARARANAWLLEQTSYQKSQVWRGPE